MSLPPVIVTKRSTPSRCAWSSSACERVTSRESVSEALESSKSGRTPVHTRSARACLKPGTRHSPSSSIASTSFWWTVWSSGSSVWTSVVPMTLTVRIGTMMSPSDGIVQRLMTVFTSRWFIAIMIPRPGRMRTPSMPAISAMCPAHAPAALTVTRASTSVSSPVRSSRRRAPVTSSPSRWTAIAPW